jgi:hypothetical protein
MVRQSVTRDGNMFVQYGRGYQQHGGEEQDFAEELAEDSAAQQAKREEEIEAEQAELEAEEREIETLFREMVRAEMLAGRTVTAARAMELKQMATGQVKSRNASQTSVALSDVGNNSSMFSDAMYYLTPTTNPQDYVNPFGQQDRRDREPEPRQDDSTFDWSGARSKNPDPERKESATEDQTSADSGQVRAGIASLDKDRNSLMGASSLDRIRILEAMQMDANLQALVLAGLMDWDDIMSKNTDNVVAPDGTVPETMVDEKKLEALQSRLLAIGAQQQQTEQVQLRRRIKQRATPGPKPGGTGFFGKKDVYMPPRYLLGVLPGLKNKVLV